MDVHAHCIFDGGCDKPFGLTLGHSESMDPDPELVSSSVDSMACYLLNAFLVQFNSVALRGAIWCAGRQGKL